MDGGEGLNDEDAPRRRRRRAARLPAWGGLAERADERQDEDEDELTERAGRDGSLSKEGCKVGREGMGSLVVVTAQPDGPTTASR